MFPHYKLSGLAYCSGSNWVGKEFEVTWVDYCGAIVVKVDKAELRPMFWLPEASILVKGFPIEEAEIDMVGMVD